MCNSTMCKTIVTITMMNDFVIAYAIQLIYNEKKKKVHSMQNSCNYVYNSSFPLLPGVKIRT